MMSSLLRRFGLPELCRTAVIVLDEPPPPEDGCNCDRRAVRVAGHCAKLEKKATVPPERGAHDSSRHAPSRPEAQRCRSNVAKHPRARCRGGMAVCGARVPDKGGGADAAGYRREGRGARTCR